ncbi:MAG: acyl-CoA dehydrogenase family protein [Dehalococcoidia bacterium]
MDFELSEAQRMLRDAVREFARREIAPIAAAIDREDRFPAELWPKLGDLGVLGVTIPEAYGGAEADLLSGVLIMEELGKVSASVALSYGAHANLCANNIAINGNEEQKRTYLPPLCSGEHIGALALTEPEAGSDAVGMRMTARREGDVFVLNGTKMFITNGSVADTLVLYAKTKPEAGSRGITAFLVESDFPGFRVGRKLDKLGHRGSPTAELILEDCQVPASNVLGEENRGVAVMMQGLAVERVFLSGEQLGIAEAALEASIQYARERKQFGQRIGDFQLIQAKLADMYTEIEAARWLIYRTAVVAERAAKGSGERVDKEAAAAILYGGEMAFRVANQAVQIHGGYGYMNEAPVSRYLRDAKLLEIGAGTSEIRRLLIGRALVGE